MSAKSIQSDRLPKRDSQLDVREAELTALSRHLIRIAEEQKAKLARKLHDTLGSNLTAINMDLNWIAKRLPADRPELSAKLQRALRVLNETADLKHEVIEELRPSHLDNLGLAFAVRTYCREFTRTSGVPCEVVAHEDFDDLGPVQAIALYRVLQEALTNVAKHSRADAVWIDLTREQRGTRLLIRDNGVGLAALAGAPASLGLAELRERVESIDGVLQVTSAANNNGTLVDAFIPMVEPLASR